MTSREPVAEVTPTGIRWLKPESRVVGVRLYSSPPEESEQIEQLKHERDYWRKRASQRLLFFNEG